MQSSRLIRHKKRTDAARLQCVFFILLVAVSLIHASSTISITSNPSNAQIWIDDTYVGVTPLHNRILYPGRHKIIVIEESQKTNKMEDITIVGDTTITMHVEFNASNSSLAVRSTPPGALVILSSPIGNTPLQENTIMPGSYTVEIRHPDKRYASYYQSIFMGADENLLIEKKLAKEKILTWNGYIRIGLGLITAGSFALGYSAIKEKERGVGLLACGIGISSLIGIEIASFLIVPKPENAAARIDE